MPDGFVVERLNTADSALAAAGVVAAADVRAVASRGQGAERNTVDALDDFLLRRYLLVYSDRGTALDCVVDGGRPAVLEYLRARDGAGYYYHLQLGAASKLTSRVFKELFASADLKARLETDLRSVLPNADSARLAANAAFNAMRRQIDSDKAVGAYRFLIIKGHPQVWTALQRQQLIRSECSGKAVSHGVVAVSLDTRERLVESATGANLKAAISAVVDAAKVNDVVAAAQASLNVEIKRAAEKSISVDLSSPVVVPLRWKPDKLM